MSLSQFFNKQIIATESFSLTVYNFLIIGVVIAIATLILFIARKAILRSSNKIDPGIRRAIYQIIKYLIIIITTGIVLESVGIKITLLFAGSAALLVGLGIGIQQIFNDFMSGFILLFERTITVDDIIEVDEMVAKVKRIGLRTSELETRDNIIILVPNSKLVSDNVINWSHNRKFTRFRVSVGVAYGSNVELVRKLLYDATIIHPDVSNDKEPTVRFTDFGDSALLFEVLFWSNNMFEIENVRSEIRFTIDQMFRQHNVQIPFPQRDIHIKTKV